MRTIELIIKENIENTIRKLLPVKEILKDHLDNFDNNEVENQKRIENQTLQAALLNEIRSLRNNIHSDYSSQSDNSDINQNLTDDEENNSPTEIIISNSPNNSIEEVIEKNTINPKPVVEEYVSNAKEGYESPDEAEIAKACNEVQIVSGVPDITATTQDNTPNVNNIPVTEVKYDNVEIIDPNKTNSDLMESFKNNLENLNSKEIENPVSDILSPRKNPIEEENKPILQVTKIKEPEEIKVEKLDMNPPPPIIDPKPVEDPKPIENPKPKENPKPIEDPLIKGVLMNTPKKDNNIKEITIVKKDETQSNLGSIGENSETKSEPLKPFNEKDKEKELKEIISVEVNNDDTETVDNFVNDINRLMEQKGLEVENTPRKYTLFDDAAENE